MTRTQWLGIAVTAVGLFGGAIAVMGLAWLLRVPDVGAALAVDGYAMGAVLGALSMWRAVKVGGER